MKRMTIECLNIRVVANGLYISKFVPMSDDWKFGIVIPTQRRNTHVFIIYIIYILYIRIECFCVPNPVRWNGHSNSRILFKNTHKINLQNIATFITAVFFDHSRVFALYSALYLLSKCSPILSYHHCGNDGKGGI